MNDASDPKSEVRRAETSEFLDAVRKGALIGAALLMLIIPLKMMQPPKEAAKPAVAMAPATPPQQAPTQPPIVAMPVPEAAPQPALPEASATAPAPSQAAPQPAQRPLPPARLAQFGDAKPSEDVKHVANWVAYTRDNGSRSFVVVDKKFAQVYVFAPDARLVKTTPALLGAAVGDHSVPGIGDKPLKLVKPHEKTTPAGRFVAEIGKNLTGEDVVWVDYENAVSMHRMRASFPKAERRPQRLASPTHEDNRVSNGCINLPVTFYEGVLSPTVRKTGAVVYVLPEVKKVDDVFGSWDVTSPLLQAQHAAAVTRKANARAAATTTAAKRAARAEERI